MHTYLDVKPAGIKLVYTLAARNTKNLGISLSQMTISYNFLPLVNFVNTRRRLDEECSPENGRQIEKVLRYVSWYASQRKRSYDDTS